MARFRKKPVVIEAEQWLGRDSMSSRGLGVVLDSGQVRFLYGHAVCPTCGGRPSEHGWVPTLEHGHVACPGDWIITGLAGEKYPCKPDIFEATYDPEPDSVEPITGHWREQGL